MLDLILSEFCWAFAQRLLLVFAAFGHIDVDNQSGRQHCAQKAANQRTHDSDCKLGVLTQCVESKGTNPGQN